MSKNSPNLGTPTVKVAAGAEVTFQASGTFLNCVKSTGSSGDLQARLGQGNWVRFDQGDKPRAKEGDQFDNFTIKNTSAGTITITVAVGDGDFDTAQQVSISGEVQTSENSADTLTSTVDKAVPQSAATQLLAANATRKTAFIKSLQANSANIRIGDSNVAADRGHELCPGETITLDYTGAIYAWNPDAADQTVSLLETVA